MLNELELTGRARSHVVQRDDLRAAIHPQALDAFLEMRAAAALAGIDLAIVSSFRDFWAQQRIWDMKFRGERPLYDREGLLCDRRSMSEWQAAEAILCWSALPGASRHHWGTELDLVDRAAMPENYRVQLVPQEWAAGGVFADLGGWLDTNLRRFGFFRPYAARRGGVSPEPWHVSFAPVSVPASEGLTCELLAAAIRGSDMLAKALVLEHLPEIYRRYVVNVDPAPPEISSMARS